MAGVNTMNQLKRGVVLFLVIAATVLPWTAAEALETFEKAGRIVKIDTSQLTISGQVYRLRSSTVIVSDDPSRKRAANLKSGDRIYIKGILLNGVYYIDKLVYIIPEPS
jgi:hypothetical protein